MLWNARAIRITSASVLAGIAIGVIGSAFRYCLLLADSARDALVLWAHAWPYTGWLVPVALAAGCAGLARAMVVRFAPSAAGSGVQYVEAVMAGEAKLLTVGVVPVKYIGGLLALGSGLALGREGPTVQMGASLGSFISQFLLRDEEDHRFVYAAGAGAGLAVAFNAPVSGSVFVFEELTRSFTPWLLVGTFAATSVAVWAMRLMLGNTVAFTVLKSGSSTEVGSLIPFLFLGALVGVVGAL